MTGQETGRHRERQSRHLDALAVVLEGYGLGVVRRYEEPLFSPFCLSSLGASLGSCAAPEEAAWVVARRLSPESIARTLEEDLSACKRGS